MSKCFQIRLLLILPSRFQFLVIMSSSVIRKHSDLKTMTTNTSIRSRICFPTDFNEVEHIWNGIDAWFEQCLQCSSYHVHIVCNQFFYSDKRLKLGTRALQGTSNSRGLCEVYLRLKAVKEKMLKDAWLDEIAVTPDVKSKLRDVLGPPPPWLLHWQRATLMVVLPGPRPWGPKFTCLQICIIRCKHGWQGPSPPKPRLSRFIIMLPELVMWWSISLTLLTHGWSWIAWRLSKACAHRSEIEAQLFLPIHMGR